MADNTITALRVLQAGIEAVRATNVLTMDTQPTANDTIVIDGKTYTWVASGAVSGQINRGADLAAAKVNLVAAINGTDAIQAGPHPTVIATTFVSNDMTITARIPGTAANSIACTETFTAGTNVWAAATMTSGAQARGTPVAATTRLAVEQLEFGDDDEQVYNPQVQNGNLTRYFGPGTPVQHGTRFTLPDQAAIWEQLPLWLSMMLGEPAVTGALGGPYTYTWTASPSAYPNPMALTLQRRFSNGADNVDERAAYAMLSQLGLSFAVNEQLRMGNGQGFARAFGSNAITAGLSLPTYEVLVSALSTVYFDALWANVGTTLLATQVIGWNWTHFAGLFPRHTAEGRTTLDFTKHQINGLERGIDLEVQCLLDPTTYAAELTRAGASATNQFAVEVRVTGSDSRSLKIQQMMQHDTALWSPGVDQGQDVVTFRLRDAADATNFLKVILILPDLVTW